MSPRIIIALDYPRIEQARSLLERLDPARCAVKVGKEMFTRSGPELVQTLVGEGFRVFLDLKYHDIPHTVGRACQAAAELGVWMLNVHALGGRRMLEAAREALEGCGTRPKLIAVTLLTSMSPRDMGEVGLEGTPEQAVIRLARLSSQCGLDGVVCSPAEIQAVRACCGGNFAVVTPGIRMVDDPKDDQRRTLTAAEAVREGADFLVIGRPITQSDDPMRRLLTIESEIADIAAP